MIEPGAINLMTAGRGIVHSERSPQALRPDGPSLYGMQTWLALPDGSEEVDAGVRPCRRRTALPFIEDGGAPARVLMGTLVGRDRGDAAAIRRPSMPISSLAAGGSIPIDAEADERAVMLVGGEAQLDGAAARAVHALRAEAGPCRAAVERARRAS